MPKDQLGPLSEHEQKILALEQQVRGMRQAIVEEERKWANHMKEAHNGGTESTCHICMSRKEGVRQLNSLANQIEKEIDLLRKNQ